MTQKQKERLYSVFRWNNDSETKETRSHFTKPETVTDLNRIAMLDKWANDDIKRLEEQIELLKIYRLGLAEQYNFLTTASTFPVVELKREKSYYENKVYYYLITYDALIDTDQQTNYKSVKYSGKERKQAIEAYEEYKKAHPGIKAILNIEKGQWEK